MSNDTQVLRATLETALARIKDMLADDDGQAFKEARKFLESARPLASPTAPSTEASEPVGDEQSAFEDWLYRAYPSGDVTEVQRQWEASSDFAEWSAEARALKGTP